ncbi:Erum7620/ECH_0207 family putative T1SS effector [Anaplasma bovis]|uniref:Erum7620/ECH_0207 family putative T1SS effector n=1 Tax=Anaplasma bovis TaxID=186733 RepID=UPI002FF0293C
MTFVFGMDFYYIYTNSLGKTECTKGGFCLGAFVLTFFFTLSKKLWLLSLLILASSSVLYSALHAEVISMPCYLLLEFVVKAYVGCSYFCWLHAKLKRTGYSLAGVVLAHDHRHARLVFMEQQSKEEERGSSQSQPIREGTKGLMDSETSSGKAQNNASDIPAAEVSG